MNVYIAQKCFKITALKSFYNFLYYFVNSEESETETDTLSQNRANNGPDGPDGPNGPDDGGPERRRLKRIPKYVQELALKGADHDQVSIL